MCFPPLSLLVLHLSFRFSFLQIQDTYLQITNLGLTFALRFQGLNMLVGVPLQVLVTGASGRTGFLTFTVRLFFRQKVRGFWIGRML
jgi:hypothetical protein